jgi:hypothetical protein
MSSGTHFNRSAGSIVRSEYNELVVGSSGRVDVDREGALAKVSDCLVCYLKVILSCPPSFSLF